MFWKVYIAASYAKDWICSWELTPTNGQKSVVAYSQYQTFFI